MPIQIDNFEVVTQPETRPAPQDVQQPVSASTQAVSPSQVQQILRRMAQRASRLRAD